MRSALVGWANRSELPLRTVNIVGVFHPLDKIVCLRHGFADQGGLCQDFLLACIRLEGLPFFDAEFFQHGQENAVPFGDRFAVQHIGQPFPILQMNSKESIKQH